MPADPLTVATLAQAAANLSALSTTLLREATRLDGPGEPVPLQVKDLPLRTDAKPITDSRGRRVRGVRVVAVPECGVPMLAVAVRWDDGDDDDDDDVEVTAEWPNGATTYSLTGATLYPLAAFPYLAARWVAEHGDDDAR